MRHYKVKPIHALSRGLEVLQALQQMRAASLHDLHQVTGIPKSTLTRILYTCHRQGLVWQRMADGAFLPSHTVARRVRLEDASWLAEISSPVLEGLCERVMWPSVLSVPRLDYMEVVETNSPRAYFDEVPVKPIGFRANMLRSASGRAYLAFCPDQERDAVLRRLRERDVPGHELAHHDETIRRLVEATRRRGYSVRAPDFGGDYAKTRDEVDDGRNSIAMPIRVGGHVLGCINLTWRRKQMTPAQMAERHLEDLGDAVRTVEKRAAEALG
ncbi:MAG: helix-turn-helix domain-containing protein [Streptosporangiales bacterium]|nr:helix-turn-helix domain-containing protein [Streptosporangiales bacterium]